MSYRIERPVDIQADRHIGLGELESCAAGQMLNVLAPASRQIVDADDSVAPGGQSVAQVRAEKARPAGNQDSHVSSCTLRTVQSAAAGAAATDRCPVPKHLIVQPASRQRC